MPNTTNDEGPSRDYYTREELDELGIEYPEPPERACRHCGRALESKAFIALKSVIWIADEECGCEESERAKAEERRIQAAREAHEKRKRYLSCGIERRFLTATVSNAECAEYIAGFEQSGGRGLFITGCVGAGKTYLASAIARHLIDAGKSVRMATSADMLAAIQSTFDNESSSLDAIHAFGGASLLVIDDLGKESASDWSLSTLFQIVNMRYGAMLPTIVTSQYPFSKLIERFARRGDEDTAVAIVSRLKETCTLIKLEDRNRRLEK